MSVSLGHEMRVQLFQEHPEMAPQLLSECFGLQLPHYDHAVVQCADLGSALPVERRADAVVALLDSAVIARMENQEVTEMAIVVEVQHRADPVKWRRWAEYAAACGGRELCPVVVLVVCPERKVAEGYDQWYEVGPLHRFRPLVLGPDRLPLVADPEGVAASPALAVLSATAHSDVPGVLAALVDGLNTIDPEKATDYTVYAAALADEAARNELEAIVKVRATNYRSVYSDRLRAEGREKGIEEGREKGIEEGSAAARSILLSIAKHRGLVLDDAQRARIEACSDLEALQRWADRALDAAAAGDIFA